MTYDSSVATSSSTTLPLPQDSSQWLHNTFDQAQGSELGIGLYNYTKITDYAINNHTETWWVYASTNPANWGVYNNYTGSSWWDGFIGQQDHYNWVSQNLPDKERSFVEITGVIATVAATAEYTSHVGVPLVGAGVWHHISAPSSGGWSATDPII